MNITAIVKENSQYETITPHCFNWCVNAIETQGMIVSKELLTLPITALLFLALHLIIPSLQNKMTPETYTKIQNMFLHTAITILLGYLIVIWWNT